MRINENFVWVILFLVIGSYMAFTHHNKTQVIIAMMECAESEAVQITLEQDND